MVAHARILFPIELLEKYFLPYDAEKLRSKFGEDRSINDVTILSTDGQTPDTGHMSVFCPMLCIALDWQQRGFLRALCDNGLLLQCTCTHMYTHIL